MSILDEDMVALLRGAGIAHLALVDQRGDPHVSPVWADVDDDGRVIVNTAEGRKKAKLLQVGAPVSMTVLDADSAYRYVGLQGVVVERTHEGAVDMINRLAQKYWGRDYRMQPGMQRVTVLIDVRSAYLYGR